MEIKQPRCLRGCLRPGRKLSCQDPHIAVQQGPARAFRRVAFDSTGPAARCRPRSVEALSGHSMCEFSAGLENFEVTRTSAPPLLYMRRRPHKRSAPAPRAISPPSPLHFTLSQSGLCRCPSLHLRLPCCPDCLASTLPVNPPRVSAPLLPLALAGHTLLPQSPPCPGLASWG